MNGVMIPEVSAGSNQIGASEMWTPQISCPCGAARAIPGAPAARPSAAIASTSRRVTPIPSPPGGNVPAFSRDEPICLLHAAPVIGGAFFREVLSRALDRDVLVRSGIGEGRDQPEPRLADPRPKGVDEGQLPDRRKHRLVVE